MRMLEGWSPLALKLKALASAKNLFYEGLAEAKMYSTGENWYEWMKDFRFGTLAYIPVGALRKNADDLRLHFDPNSAASCAAHITLTQPFTAAPTDEDIIRIQNLISGISSFDGKIGPTTTSPNKRLLWWDVTPKDSVLDLREKLHETGLFRTDLPLTKGFIPHLTLSEKGREPSEVDILIEDLNQKYQPANFSFDGVTWIVPDESFVFREHRLFSLKNT